jgi:ribosomal protein S18 acetylase RimI-like enzyme
MLLWAPGDAFDLSAENERRGHSCARSQVHPEEQGSRPPRSAECDASAMDIRLQDSLDHVDWVQAKTDLAADDFDNGRSADALRRSFEQSQHVAIARDGDRVVGMARLLSDGVCNAYLLDVWTASPYRRQGIATSMVRLLLEKVPGQHVGLQTDDAQQLYELLEFHAQPEFWSRVVGAWLDNEANSDSADPQRSR